MTATQRAKLETLLNGLRNRALKLQRDLLWDDHTDREVAEIRKHEAQIQAQLDAETEPFDNPEFSEAGLHHE